MLQSNTCNNCPRASPSVGHDSNSRAPVVHNPRILEMHEVQDALYIVVGAMIPKLTRFANRSDICIDKAGILATRVTCLSNI